MLAQKLGIKKEKVKKKSKKKGLIQDKGPLPKTYIKPKMNKAKIPKPPKSTRKSPSPQSRNLGLNTQQHQFTGKRVKKTRNQSWNMTVNTKKISPNTQTLGKMMKLNNVDQTPLLKNDKTKEATIKNAIHKMRKLETINNYDLNQFESKEANKDALRKEIIQERMDINDQLVDEIEEKLKLFDVISCGKTDAT